MTNKTAPDRYALVGHPVDHSRSPLIHTVFARQTGQRLTYELIDAEPDVYYVTDHYANFPSVLVRLSRIHRDALRDLLAMAWQTASAKRAGVRRRVRS